MRENDVRKTISDNIRLYRSRLALSQAVLAEKADISIAFLSNIERGNKWPHPDTLFRIAGALNVEVYELFKPDAGPPDDKPADIDRWLDDILVALKQSVDKSMTHSIAKIRKSYR
jgi:transcriptional regulator with XRE-family HTH domain